MVTGISTSINLESLSISSFNLFCKKIVAVEMRKPLKVSLSLLAYNNGIK